MDSLDIDQNYLRTEAAMCSRASHEHKLRFFVLSGYLRLLAVTGTC